MAWLACDKDGTECQFKVKPDRMVIPHLGLKFWCVGFTVYTEDASKTLPSGTIEKLIGRPLTWRDEPVEI